MMLKKKMSSSSLPLQVRTQHNETLHFSKIFTFIYNRPTTTTIDRYDIKNSFFFVEKLLQKARGIQEQQPLLSKIQGEGIFKSVDHVKTTQQQDEMKPKYNLVCIGSTKDQKNWMILSERVQNEHSWSTAILTKAPLEIKKKNQTKSPQTNLNIKEC